jgi:hypothetical protein
VRDVERLLPAVGERVELDQGCLAVRVNTRAVGYVRASRVGGRTGKF